ncbi:hypothetical protein QBC47DRAFT_395875 [Echria macrotheca]|uniref:NADPH-dependent 1-acyldihydroxyacetone phosphate reductase n=1 Tax=Echria macrotheca TaxID=438768 RepID=A0AAJ0F3F8_9PEZI|nr:hypothetical protein QBC47DRAFT_395875 [Echria macrotheca]
MAPKNRSVLITGCSDGGLGSALALAFHKAGWRVFASARNLSKLKVAEAAGIETVQLDTLSDESISACVSRIAELTGGSLDCFVNNAGAGYTMPLADLDINKAKELFDLNLWSVITVTRAFLPLIMKAAPGALIVINSSGSSLPAGMLPFAGAYNASKAAVAAIAENFRVELEPFGIRTVNIITGAVQSNFGNNRLVKPQLPPNSIYNIAKEETEYVMANEDVAAGMDPILWAEKVVSDLSKKKPPYWVWRGKFSFMLWLSSFLPIGATDSISKNITGMGKIDKKIMEATKGDKVKST